MSIPAALQQALEGILGRAVRVSRPLPGGDINHAAQLDAGETRFFLKWHVQAPPGMFSSEARSLSLLADTQTLRVPQVIAHGEAAAGMPGYLLLEWLPLAPAQNPLRAAERLGEGLAALHRHSAAAYGLGFDNFIGLLPQQNPWTTDWRVFYRDHRLGVQIAAARGSERLPAQRERLLDALLAKLSTLIPVEEAPALLHGDLWGGNYATLADNQAVIYDPAIYYGHREVDLAMTRLFGGFPPRFYEAYQASYPLAPGFEERLPLYQLYPLLVHLNLFGGHYGAQVDALARRYVQGQGAGL